MQTQTPAPGAPSAQPPAIQTPTPPALPSVAPPALAQTPGEALQSLIGQLTGLEVQRNFLIDKLRGTPQPGQPVLRAQLAQLDAQIATVRAQITAEATALRTFQGRPGLAPPPHFPRTPGMSDNDLALSIVFVLAVLMPLSIGITRFMWRRASKAPASPSPSQDHMLPPRLERLEQAVDAIAIEVERISEGQRFAYKLLSDKVTGTASLPSTPPA